ncbi:hypothetical protein KLEP7_gp59 [Pseudaeromonas phage vB_PpeM_ KLEP7]|nr:hypothetical protein KLEP7_gp59 [Pseudaeromonas phage vB_PpeM_ KLEP7]
MIELSFEEQDLIIDKLIEKYFDIEDCVVGYCAEDNKSGKYTDIRTNIPYIKDLCLYKSDSNFSGDLAQASVEFSYNDVYKEYTIQELQQKYFQDVLTPTQNELIMFELTEGFEYPLQSKFLKKEQTNEFLETENQADSSFPYLVASPWSFDLPKFEDMLVSKGLWFSTLYLADIEDNMKYTFLSQEELSVAKELLDSNEWNQ